MLFISMFIILFFNNCLGMEQQKKPLIPTINLEDVNTKTMPKTNIPSSSEEKQQEHSPSSFIFFDSQRTDSLDEVRLWHIEFNEFLENVSISMERFAHKSDHPYKDIVEIRVTMENIKNKMIILKKLHKELIYQYKDACSNRLKVLLVRKLDNSNVSPRKNRPQKLNYTIIQRKLKKTQDTPKKQVLGLQELLALENQHLKNEDRERLSLLIYSCAGCLPIYSEILDKKI